MGFQHTYRLLVVEVIEKIETTQGGVIEINGTRRSQKETFFSKKW